MDAASESPPPSPQTDRFIFWGSLFFLLTVGFFMFATLREEELRLDGLHQLEADRRAELEGHERALAQETQTLSRFTDNREFVRDQARERLGVAAPDEVVVRLEPGAGAGPSPARTGPSLFSPPPAE